MSRIARRLSLFVAFVCLLTASEALAAPGQRAARKARFVVELTGTNNLNTATEAQLALLPGVGASKARRIVEHRAKRKFTSTAQVMRVKGIGKKTYRKLKPHLAVSGLTTLVRSKRPAEAVVTPKPQATRTPVKAARRVQ